MRGSEDGDHACNAVGAPEGSGRNVTGDEQEARPCRVLHRAFEDAEHLLPVTRHGFFTTSPAIIKFIFTKCATERAPILSMTFAR